MKLLEGTRVMETLEGICFVNGSDHMIRGPNKLYKCCDARECGLKYVVANRQYCLKIQTKEEIEEIELHKEEQQ